MLHRHLNHQGYTLAAVDDVISRGQWEDWAAMRRAAMQEPALFNKIRQVCRGRVRDPYEQRYHFWMNYADKHS